MTPRSYKHSWVLHLIIPVALGFVSLIVYRVFTAQQEFARELGSNFQFRGMRFRNRANAPSDATGQGAAWATGPRPTWSQTHIRLNASGKPQI